MDLRDGMPPSRVEEPRPPTLSELERFHAALERLLLVPVWDGRVRHNFRVQMFVGPFPDGPQIMHGVAT